jgi:hypothetical protein
VGGVVAALMAAATPPCSEPQVSAPSLKEWSQNAATIVSRSGRGSGLVVGWEPGSIGQTGLAWIALPAHVVYGTDEPGSDALPGYRAGLTVRLAGDRDARTLCSPATRPNPTPPQGDLDLAFVCVEWKDGPYFNTGLAARQIAVGNRLVLVDPSRVRNGRLSAIAAEGEKTGRHGDLEVEGLGEGTLEAVEGFSGSIIASAAGVVGLHLGLGARARALSLSAIRMAAERARIPWQLADYEFFDCSKTRRVCLSVEGEVGPSRVDLTRPSQPAAASIEVNQCADIPSNKYQIAIPTGDPTCEPSVVNIFADASNLALSLRCAPALRGAWRTEEGDELMCVSAEPGNAQCTGLQGLGLGFLQARLTARGRRVDVLGMFIDGLGNQHTAKGDLTWTPHRLVGEVHREGYPPRTIDLTRDQRR